MSKIIFSIIIPLYNKEHYILHTLRTVLKQDFEFYEIIVINDGSTDNSHSILNSISDVRLKVYSQKNAGVSEARNRGMKLANGQYICFLDADDEMHPHYLKNLYTYIQSSGFKSVYFSNYLIERNGKQTPMMKDFPVGLFEKYLEMMISGVSPLFTGAICIHKDAMSNIRFPKNIRFGEDLFVWFKLYSMFDFYYTGIISTTYKADVIGSLSNIRFEGVTPEIIFMEEHYQQLLRMKKFSRLDEYLKHRYYKFGKVNAFNNNKKYLKDIFLKLIQKKGYFYTVLLIVYYVMPNQIISIKRKLI